MLFDQNGNAGEVDKGEERIITFVIPSGYAPEILEFLKETLDKMTFFIQPPVAVPFESVCLSAWDVGYTISAFNISNKLRAVISLIRKNDASIYRNAG